MNESDNVIDLTQFWDSFFTQNDKRIIEEVRVRFVQAGMPHTITYGTTDEGEEWCLVSSPRSPDPVAEIRRLNNRYIHRGNWGYCQSNTLIGMFNQILPDGLKDTAEMDKIQKDIRNG